MSYRDAGVDIDAGDALVEAIKPYARRTMRPEVLAGIGGFGALCEIPKKYRQPVLVSSTDGVGTKLKLAFALGRHDTIGIDLVAMCVNDVVVQGAEPLFFLDYFATGRLDTEQARRAQVGLADRSVAAEGEVAHGGKVVQVGILTKKRFHIGPRPRQFLILHLQFDLVHLQFVEEALGSCLRRGRSRFSLLACAQLCFRPAAKFRGIG